MSSSRTLHFFYTYLLYSPSSLVPFIFLSHHLYLFMLSFNFSHYLFNWCYSLIIFMAFCHLYSYMICLSYHHISPFLPSPPKLSSFHFTFLYLSLSCLYTFSLFIFLSHLYYLICLPSVLSLYPINGRSHGFSPYSTNDIRYFRVLLYLSNGWIETNMYQLFPRVNGID
jgi:hypothetical protein